MLQKNGADNSVNGDYCKDCFKDICETIINIEEEKKEEVVGPEINEEEKVEEKPVEEPAEEEKTEEAL